MDLEEMAKWAKIKGVKVLGTGDFTHPLWLKNIREKLVPAEKGLFRLASDGSQEGQQTLFLLTAEISCVYSKNGRTRKIHILVFAPSLDDVEKINAQLGWIGNLKADGRPILGLDAKELVKIILSGSEDCLVVPAHMYTPWFSLFGSKSGFDYIKECFEEYSQYIFAGETGLSSDPPMSWRNPDLDGISLISNSDSHSPSRIGREANVFETSVNYHDIIGAIKEKNPEKFLYTVEFFPEEGKYHYDGHRLCGISLHPSETKKYNGICPVCKKPLTIGVLSRVEQLSGRPEGFIGEGRVPFKRLVPLEEIIAEALDRGTGTVEVEKEYKKLVENFGSEFNVLLSAEKRELSGCTLPQIAEGIIRVREGKIIIDPGYDGEYGKIRIFSKTEQKNFSKQATLF